MCKKCYKHTGISAETRRAMGISRSRATSADIEYKEGRINDLPAGLNAHDFYCDAEQAEIDDNGIVRRSRPSRITRQKKG